MDHSLIEKYFNGQCTRSEIAEVLEWFQTLEGRQYLENELDRDIQFVAELGNVLDDVEPDSEQLFDRIRSTQSSGAVFATNKRTSRSQWKKVAGIIIILGILSLFAGIFVGNWETQKVVKTQSGEKKTVVLPDNSHIILHSNSSLTYQAAFEKREVLLEGEAYFEVEHDEARPFVVFVEDSYVKVLGTKFVVSEYSGGGRVEVAVKSGRVEFGSHNSQSGQSSVKQLEVSNTRDEKTIEITKKQVGVRDKDSEPILADSSNSDELFDWIEGKMIFRSTPVKEVLAELENRYGVKFVLGDSELAKERFTSSFDNETLPEVLKVLTLSLDVRYKRVGNKIYFSN